MSPAFRETLSRIASRVVGSPLAKPAARVALAGAGLVLLAIIGRSAIAGAGGAAAAYSSPALPSAHAGASTPSTSIAPGATTLSASAGAPGPPATTPSPPSSSQTALHPSSQASPDDPVVLNTATADDLRRLPGVGEKRAALILALRTQLGRFRAVEDLLKVKGIGRATLKRLRPLVRLDAPPSATEGTARPPDAGSAGPR
jgi:competence protein ComEA